MTATTAREAAPGTVYAFHQGPSDISNVVEVTRATVAGDVVTIIGRWLLVDRNGTVHGDPIAGTGTFATSDEMWEVQLHQAPGIAAALATV